ncbi:MAG: UvrD-helicase domain-containing protein, partial [Thiobacillaceae bacterium]|nr:UvrD-helicase domain-containing protein [Thiobacillaceae bacterium]
AITFTRKAAQEMRERLYQWLERMALAPAAEVVDFLVERGLSQAEARAALPRAQGLFEQVLTSRPGPMITTFHGWFLHLLRQAPLAVRAPQQVVEDGALLLQEAWQTWTAGLAQQVGSAEERALRWLLGELPLSSVRQLLMSFVGRRAEWWAWATGRADPCAEAWAALGAPGDVDEAAQPVAELLTDGVFIASLREYRPLLARQLAHSTRDAGRLTALEEALAALQGAPPVDAAALARVWERLVTVLLTQEGSPRIYKDGPTLRGRLGADAERFLALHDQLAARVQAVQRQLAAQRARRLHRMGLTAGLGLLAQYQRLKQARDAIDFTDAEWLAWRLLTDAEAGPAVLMRLDARWRHVLIDEFQDTNPLQWQVLRAWLDAYGRDGERPSLFLVGDPKQSIYRFRRAEPLLFAAAAQWLQDEWDALHIPHDSTRRLAPRVAAWVNAVFAGRADYPGFTPHTALARDLPGLCELIVVPRQRGGDDERSEPRDPLTEPPPSPPQARALEAQAVAARIQAMVGRLLVRDAAGERPARHGDILLLAARRSQLEVFEQALRRAGIPYIGTRRGGLLDTLEAADLMALLHWLTTPGDDLALAHVLRSPICAFDDADLLSLATRSGPHWHARLMAWAAEAQAPAHVRRAAGLLEGWLNRAGCVPAHDLIDRIVHEGELPARYAAAAPAHLRTAVLANLQALLELTLKLSGARYPSLPRLLDELTALQEQAGEEGPDEPPAAQADAVRMLTIHAAKGLEAPIVFLLKADEAEPDPDPYGVLLDWPVEASAPRHFVLYGPKAWQSEAQAAAFAQERARMARERLNLLYVAMTRARQALVLSGLDDAGPDSWLVQARTALERIGPQLAVLPAMAECTAAVQAVPPQPAPAPLSSPPLGQRRTLGPPQAALGVQVHRYLELAGRGWAEAAIRQDLGLDAETYARVRTQAQRLLDAPALARFFDPRRYRAASNELEFVDGDGQLRRIDRVVEFDDEVWVLDYKTGETEPATALARHQTQLAAYRQAIRHLYPDRRVRAALVLADGTLAEVGDDIAE